MKFETSRYRLAALALVGLASIAGHFAMRQVIPPRASLAGANALSASIGLAHGEGMTISSSEGIAIKMHLGPDTDARTVYAPDDDRVPLLEPLPGLVLIYFMLGTVGFPLTFTWIWFVNVAVMSSVIVLLTSELMHRRFLFGLMAGLSVALFVPIYRISVIIGYDPFEFAALVAAVFFLLRYSRTHSPKWLLANGICLGIGLWIRSYFILYVAAQGLVVAVLLARDRLPWMTLWRWIAPVLLLAVSLVAIRDAGSTGARLTRGAFWHSFWAGVGQFENDQIQGDTDWDVCELAVRKGFDSPCDQNYGDPKQTYLFQYGSEYNRVLAEAGWSWIGEHPATVVRNTVMRMFWLAVPGTMPSTRVGSTTAGRVAAIILSVALLLLALTAIRLLGSSETDDLLVLGGTYSALLPLSVFYITAKVVVISYFCVIILAVAGVLALKDRRADAV